MLEQEIQITNENFEQQIEIENEQMGFVPSGTKDIQENGLYDVNQYANVDVNVPGIIPTGEIDITSNGSYNVYDYESANVLVPGIIPSGTKTITTNGLHNVYDYAGADVQVPEPSGTVNIDTNGQHNVSGYAVADVNVPGIVPSGTKTITSNGTYDVTDYANVSVNVPAGISTLSDYSYMFMDENRISNAQDWINIANNVRNCDSMFRNVANAQAISNFSVNLTNFDTSNVGDMSSMFQGCQYLNFEDIIGLGNLKTQNVTTTENMFNQFARNVNLQNQNKYWDLSNWNVGKITDMPNMFRECIYGATNRRDVVLDLSNWDTSKLTNMYYMFYQTRFTSIKFDNWDTSKVTDFRYAFSTMPNITELDLSSFTSEGSPNCNNMFSGSHSALTKLDMRKFDFTNVSNSGSMFGSSNTNGIPTNCLVIVKDATQKTWVNTNFSRLANVKTVAEYEG